MTEQKAKRVIVASTVGAVILAFILIFVMVWQMCKINSDKKKIAYYNAKIAEYNRLIDDANGENEKAKTSRDWLIYEAQKLGYIFDGDLIIG